MHFKQREPHRQRAPGRENMAEGVGTKNLEWREPASMGWGGWKPVPDF